MGVSGSVRRSARCNPRLPYLAHEVVHAEHVTVAVVGHVVLQQRAKARHNCVRQWQRQQRSVDVRHGDEVARFVCVLCVCVCFCACAYQ